MNCSSSQVPQEVWALNPANGKLAWYCETQLPGNVSPSVNFADGMIYVTGGYPGTGSVAFKAEGKGDITSNIAWKKRDASYVASPVLHEGHLYWINDKGIAFCMNAETGETVYKERLVGGGGRPFMLRQFCATISCLSPAAGKASSSLMPAQSSNCWRRTNSKATTATSTERLRSAVSRCSCGLTRLCTASSREAVRSYGFGHPTQAGTRFHNQILENGCPSARG